MEMNNLRTESHVAQKIRRHKLRFQQNTDDPTHQHLPQDSHFEVHSTGFGSVSYNPVVFPSEMLLAIPFVDQDSGSGSGSCNPQTSGNNWKNVISQNPFQVSNEWNVGSMDIDQSYNQDLQNISFNDRKNISFNDQSYNYQSTLQEVVTSATVGTHVNQSIPCWMNSSEQLGFVANRSNDITQGLSLSLSWSSGPKALKIEDLTDSDPRQVMGMNSFAHRNVGPLGPFTGYATILKNSKYLEPAQELLSDSCDVGGHELVETCDNLTHKILEEELSRVSGESGASSSGNYGSNEHIGGRSGSLSESFRPEFHNKKAKLLCMQQEVLTLTIFWYVNYELFVINN